MDFIAKSGRTAIGSKKTGTLTYLQVLEFHGHAGPEQPRLRILINLIALQAEAQPLNDTLMVADVSQNPPFIDMLAVGETPVFTTSASL